MKKLGSYIFMLSTFMVAMLFVFVQLWILIKNDPKFDLFLGAQDVFFQKIAKNQEMTQWLPN